LLQVGQEYHDIKQSGFGVGWPGSDGVPWLNNERRMNPGGFGGLGGELQDEVAEGLYDLTDDYCVLLRRFASWLSGLHYPNGIGENFPELNFVSPRPDHDAVLRRAARHYRV
jgi:hypothetical protein